MATIILIHPITKVFIESCDRHIDVVKKIITAGRKKKHIIYEQKSLDRSY
ncbi:MAG: hypothetical protein GPJ54_12480 [Candidatus Heimdallarchaeota archaeon]|nr:hypothetical protein [Candidatus Heimdallarchaeota archaeon]